MDASIHDVGQSSPTSPNLEGVAQVLANLVHKDPSRAKRVLEQVGEHNNLVARVFSKSAQTEPIL